MILTRITYLTLTGKKHHYRITNKKNYQFLILKNGKPIYLVDCFDFTSESNLIMNNMIISQKESLKKIIKQIIKNNNVKISLSKPPLIKIKLEEKSILTNLDPLPEKWLI